MTVLAQFLLVAAIDVSGGMNTVMAVGHAAPSRASRSEGSATKPAVPVAKQVVYLGVVEGSPVRAQALDKALPGLFSDLGVELQVQAGVGHEIGEQVRWAREQGMKPAVNGVFWLEGTAESPSRARIYLAVGGANPRTYVRELDLGPDEATAIESLAVVLRAQIQALATGAPTAAMTEVQLQAAAPQNPVDSVSPTPPIQGPPPLRPEVRFELGYSGDLLAKELPWHGGGALGLHVRAISGWAVAGTLGVLLSPTTMSAPRLRILRIPLRVAGGYEWKVAGGRLGLDAMVAGQGEWLHWALAVQAPQVKSGVPDATWRFALGPQLGLCWNFWGGWGLRVRVGMDAWLANWELQAHYGDNPARTLVDSHAVSASAFAGLSHAF